MKPHQVLLCKNCSNVLIREMGIKTTKCTTCNTRHKVEEMKWLKRDVDIDTARKIRQSAKRDILGELKMQETADIESDTNAHQTILNMIDEHEPISHTQLTGFCRLKHNMTIKTVEETISQLSEHGAITKTDEGYTCQ